MQSFDIIVIGAGIAGASAAARLADSARVLVLEREAQPGYHSTGRSAALFHDTYGKGPVIRLTRASRPFYETPPDGFTDHALLTPRGVLVFGTNAQKPKLQAALDEVLKAGAHAELVDRKRALEIVPVLRPEAVDAAVWEPDCQDLDVHSIHQGFLRIVRQHGGQIVCDADVTALSHRNGQWQVDTGAGSFTAPIVVNAAGAWCDEIARLGGVKPVGLSPKRRTAFMVNPPDGVDARRWPAAIDADEKFYFKPDAQQLLVSPANEDPMQPHDVQPDEMDIAIAVDRVESATTLQIRRIGRKWAGLRSFVDDRVMAAGYDDAAPGFFWLAGQGGYGIQTAPALSQLAAALILKRDLPDNLRQHGVDPAFFAPGRATLRREFAY